MLIEMVGMNLGIPVVLGSIIGYAVGRSRTVYDTTSQTEVEFVEAQRFRKRDRDTEEH
jgi:CIC family chloride channel protein